MNTKENSEIRELKADELDGVSGGVSSSLQGQRAPVRPAFPGPSPTSGGTGGGGVVDGGGGGGGGGFYNSGPYGDEDLHQF